MMSVLFLSLEWTGLATLIGFSLHVFVNFSVSCCRLNWLPVSFWLHVKSSYRKSIISYCLRRSSVYITELLGSFHCMHPCDCSQVFAGSCWLFIHVRRHCTAPRYCPTYYVTLPSRSSPSKSSWSLETDHLLLLAQALEQSSCRFHVCLTTVSIPTILSACCELIKLRDIYCSGPVFWDTLYYQGCYYKFITIFAGYIVTVDNLVTY